MEKPNTYVNNENLSSKFENIKYKRIMSSTKRRKYLSSSELRNRVRNLTKKYRQERRMMGTSGGSRSSWEHVEAIHQFQGSFKSNNVELLMDESLTSDGYTHINSIGFNGESLSSGESTADTFIDCPIFEESLESEPSSTREPLTTDAPSTSNAPTDVDVPPSADAASVRKTYKNKNEETRIKLAQEDSKVTAHYLKASLTNTNKMISLLEDNNRLLEILINKNRN